MSNIKEDVVKEELPVEVVETVIFPKESTIQEITYTAPTLQVEDIVIEEVAPELEPESESVILYQVRIDHPSKRYRKEPSLDSETIGLITDQGIYDVIEENMHWIRLGNGYWTMKEHTSKIKK